MSNTEETGKPDNTQPETTNKDDIIDVGLPVTDEVKPEKEETPIKKNEEKPIKAEKKGFFAEYGFYIILIAVAGAALYIYKRNRDNGGK